MLSDQAPAEPASEEASHIYPIPVSEGGGLTEKLLDSLEAIIAEFNRRHGDIEWTDRDKVNKILFRDIPEQLQEDAETVETLKNSDKQNAKISMDKKLLDLMQDLMFSHTEIHKKFVDPGFRTPIVIFENFLLACYWCGCFKVANVWLR